MRLIALIDEDEMDKMPENCRRCIFWEMFKNGEEYCVGMGHQRIFDDELLGPDWCPLRILPVRKLVVRNGLGDPEGVTDYWAAGWNACLKAIRGEPE